MKNIAIDCVLFESCNLNCSHCFQNHINNMVDINYIKSLSSIVCPIIDEEMAKSNPETLMFSLRGGELFQDKIEDDVIEEYEKFIMDVKNNFLKKYTDKNILIHLMSNGVYNNVERVIKLLKNVNGKITLSFDAFGRYPSDNQKNLFFETYRILKSENYIKNIAITLTKESINEYLNDVDLLKKFDGTDIDFNYYIPTMKESSLPSDDDLFNFFKSLIDNKFYNAIYIKNILDNCLSNEKIYPSCNCLNTTVIFNGKAYHTCNIYVPSIDLNDFYDDSSVINENNGVKIIMEKGINKRQCLLCPYYKNCSYYCWMMLCYKHYQMGICPHKRIHQYIEEHNEILKDYKLWKQ